MNSQIILDYRYIHPFIKENDIYAMQGTVDQCHHDLHNASGLGNDYLGWISLPDQISEQHLKDLTDTAHYIQSEVDYFVVIGIGGSYLGARAVIEALSNPLSIYRSKKENKTPHILWAGHHLDSDYHHHLMSFLKGKKFAINVISKSGTTTEPALVFRLLKSLLEENVGKTQAKKLIIATTDEKRGALKTLADTEGYKCFVIPDDVGGRYSVLTPVGLLPIAVAGIDIREMIKGAKDCKKYTSTSDLKNNPAYLYASIRNLLYKNGKKIEILVNYKPVLQYIGEWWKQLYGESEGKDKLGIFPATCNFTTDLHSMGQWIQDSERTLFETVIQIEKNQETILIQEDSDNLDQLNYLKGKDLTDINHQALLGTTIAHHEGEVPSMTLKIPELNEYYIGQIIYFFEMACGMSGYLLKINPFDQPGVEAYKKNMFALLNKPGSEKERDILLKKISQGTQHS